LVFSTLFLDNLLNFGVSRVYKAEIKIYPTFCPKTDGQPVHDGSLCYLTDHLIIFHKKLGEITKKIVLRNQINNFVNELIS
jgi:hypothetical protein